MQLIQSQQLTINTLELRAMVNDARAGFGESQVRNDHFLARVEDELGEEIVGVEKFCIPHHGNLVDAYTLTLEQAMLVGMRESKGVRRQVLEQLKKLQAQAAAPQFNIPTTLSGALRLAAEQAETIEAVAGMPAAMFDERGPLGTVLANLEQTAKDKPKDYAAGILGVVRVAREKISNG